MFVSTVPTDFRVKRHSCPYWNSKVLIAIILAMWLGDTGMVGFPSSVYGNDDEYAKFLFSGIKAERDKLTSGIYRAHGRRVDKLPESNHDVEWDVFGAFKQTNEYFRFDQLLELPKDYTLPPDNVPMMKELLDRDALRYVRTPDRQFLWNARSQNLVIETLDWQPDSILKAFDVRALGLSSNSGRSFQDALEVYVNRNDPIVETLANGITTISYVVASGDLRLTIWIDENRGYVPFRKEVRINIPDFPQTREFPDTELQEQEFDISWTKMGGTWVPISLRTNTKTLLTELAFDWESVNEPVPDELFTPHGLEVPDHTLMFDKRLGESVLLGNMKGPLSKRAKLVDDQAVHTSWWVMGLVGSVIIGAVVIAWLAIQRRR